MKIVTDTSILIAVLANENHKNKIIELTQDSDLIAPASLKWEIGNAFSAMFKREKITLDLAQKAIEDFNLIPIRYVDVDLYHSIEIAKKYNIYCYDAYFILCSHYERAPLMTLDKRLINIAIEESIKIIEV